MSFINTDERADERAVDATELLSRVFAPEPFASRGEWLRRSDLTAHVLACAGGEPISSRAVREVGAELMASRAAVRTVSEDEGKDRAELVVAPVHARLFEERSAFEAACQQTWRSPTRPRAALGDSLGALGPGGPLPMRSASPSKSAFRWSGAVEGAGSKTTDTGITAVEQAMLDLLRARVKGALDSGRWV